MNNKKTIYLLLPLVLLLWGYIIYRVVEQTNTEVEVAGAELPRLQPAAKAGDKKTFQLLLDYQDPFLKTISQNNLNPEADKAGKQAPKRRLHVWNWPNFTYNGCIQNHKKVVGILQINSKNLLVQEGKTYHEFNVYKLFPDSIIMERDGEKRTILRN